MITGIHRILINGPLSLLRRMDWHRAHLLVNAGLKKHFILTSDKSDCIQMSDKKPVFCQKGLRRLKSFIFTNDQVGIFIVKEMLSHTLSSKKYLT